MNIFWRGAVAFSLSLHCTLSMAQNETANELKSFTPRTNFMSLPGYLRSQYHLQTGEWKAPDNFRWGGTSIRVFCSDSEMKIDFGNLGALGDEETMNRQSTSLIAQSLETFPKRDKYAVSWTFWFVVGEGEIEDERTGVVIYNRKNKTFENTNGVQFDISDEKFFEFERRNTEKRR